MSGLKQIKSKIRSVIKTQTVTKAMEAVSAAKMRRAQERALRGRAFARAAASVLSRLSGSRALERHPLARTGRGPRVLYIVITSDKGLAGALNAAVLKAALADIKVAGLVSDGVDIIAVGRKAQEFFAKRGYRIEAYHPNTEELDAALMQEVVREAATRFAAEEVGRVVLVYQNFVSTFEQSPTLRALLPLSVEELLRMVADILPARGVYADKESPPALRAPHAVEPSEEEVLDAILPRLLGVFVYHALLESQACEHSARMIAMKNASDKAGEMEHALGLSYNKARQAAITREVSEIIGGMEAIIR